MRDGASSRIPTYLLWLLHAYLHTYFGFFGRIHFLGSSNAHQAKSSQELTTRSVEYYQYVVYLLRHLKATSSGNVDTDENEKGDFV